MKEDDTIGDDRRVLVGFDRGGWFPALFANMDAQGFDVLTWGTVFPDPRLVTIRGPRHPQRPHP